MEIRFELLSMFILSSIHKLREKFETPVDYGYTDHETWPWPVLLFAVPRNEH